MRAIAAILCLSLFLAACGSSQKVIQPVADKAAVPAKFRVQPIDDQSGKSIPSQFLTSIKGYLESELDKRQLLAAADAPAADINITVNTYRMRSGFSRMMFGMMAGKDGVGSTITLSDPGTSNVLGKTTVSTFNVMAVGGEMDVARMHAEEIAKFAAGEPIGDEKKN